MTKTLKQEVRPQLAMVIAANVAAFGVLLTTRVLAVPSLRSDLTGTSESVGLSAAAFLVCAVLTEQFGPTTKGRIVYWRWRNPLPGTRAFSDIGPRDPRVDMESIVKSLGEIPSDPNAQNLQWYKLYKKVEREPIVWDVHKSSLMTRDYACVSLLFLLTLGPIAVWRLGASTWSLVYLSLLVAQYILARNAGANTGTRLVATVLAIQPDFAVKSRKKVVK